MAATQIYPCQCGETHLMDTKQALCPRQRNRYKYRWKEDNYHEMFTVGYTYLLILVLAISPITHPHTHFANEIYTSLCAYVHSESWFRVYHQHSDLIWKGEVLGNWKCSNGGWGTEKLVGKCNSKHQLKSGWTQVRTHFSFSSKTWLSFQHL